MTRRGATSHRSRTADTRRRTRSPAALSPPRVERPFASLPRGVAWLYLALVGFALAGLAGVLAWREETSLDFGFHLATGRYILAHHAWPRMDIFTYTVPTHPYIDMHGLFQIALAGAESVGGAAGIGMLRVGGVLVALALLAMHAWRRGVRAPEAYACGVGLALCAWEIRFFARPELATYVCLAALLLLLRRHAEDGRTRWLALIPLVQLVWTYAHALSLFGPAIVAAYAMCWSARRLFPHAPVSRGVPSPLAEAAPWITLAVTLAVLWANPYGLEGVRFLWNLRTRLDAGNVFAGTISELASPFAPGVQAVWPLHAIRLLVVVHSLGVLAGLRRASLFDVVIAVVFTWLGCTAIRNIGLYVIAVTPLAMQGATGWSRGAWASARGGRGRWPAWRAVTSSACILALVGISVTVVRGSYYASDRRPERFGSGASSAVYPVGSVDFLVAQRVRGPLYNHLNFGGYLIGRLWPAEKVLIDGRLEVMGEEFYQRYLGWNSGVGWEAMMAQYGPSSVLIPYTSLEMLQRLARDPQWAFAWCDGAGVLFLRRTPANAGAIAVAAATSLRDSLAAAHDTRVLLPAARAGTLRRIFGERHLAWTDWGRGNALYGLRRYDEAHAAYAAAVRASPQDEPAQILNLAATAFRLHRVDEARAWYQRVRQLDPRNALAEARLATLAGMSSTPRH